jgi:hypothetical protein
MFVTWAVIKRLIKNFIMKRKALFTILLLSCFAVGMAAIFADLNGKWTGVLNAPDGNQYPLAYTFKVDGDKLSGALEVNGMSVPLDSGMVKGNDFKFSVTVESNAYPHTGRYYAAGDSVALDVNFMGTKTHTTLKRTP